uniref:type II and III secretion system protein family protein n=1 Tax=Altererythrobacter segetis TaxID=1104773 RepID=UPI0014076425|nr:type II and III secretion system protein family protein [Altererythrobacter segetis]
MSRRLIGGAALALWLAAAPIPSVAQQVYTPPERLHAGTLEVPLNKSQVVSLDRTIAKAMIGNEEIADIVPITANSLYVLGKKMGTTSLTLYDSGGRVLSIMDIAVGPDVQGLQEQLTGLVPGQQIDARISNDSIVLSGQVSDPGAVDRAVQVARTYAGDKVVNLMTVGSSQQVMLEVKFAEVNRNSGVNVGVSAFGTGSKFSSVTGAGAQLVPDPDTGEGLLKLLSITDTFGIFRDTFNIGGLNLQGILNAMETRGMAKTLAQPTLIALSGEPASFLAGGEFPVPVVQSGSGAANGGSTAITVEFKPFGVSLGFTPTVLSDKTISLLVQPEVSAIDPAASLTVGNITIPGLRTRRASTTLELRDGESFAIAGLLQKDFGTTIKQLPLLGSLPIIGALFRSTSFQKGETELLIIVTPHLVAPIKPGQVRLPTDETTDPTAAEAVLFGTSGQTKPLPPAANVPGVSAATPQGDSPAQPLAHAGELPAATTPAKENGYEY